MKKYYCPTCREFKSRRQVKIESDARFAYHTCRWCHNVVFATEDVMRKLIELVMIEEDFRDKYGNMF